MCYIIAQRVKAIFPACSKKMLCSYSDNFKLALNANCFISTRFCWTLTGT